MTNSYTKKVIDDEFGMEPEYATRKMRVVQHSNKIRALLASPSPSPYGQRIWRLRYFQDGQFLVATLVYTKSTMEPKQKIVTYLSRGYNYTNANGASAVQQNLTGAYSPDEIVAFLRLDLVHPDSIEWIEETPEL